MAFVHVSAPTGSRTSELLSADNSIPERHIVLDMVRQAASTLGLNASVIATLDAMLSCLPPRRSHHIVFASNATLALRRNGISDRTLRRHAAILQDSGLLVRRDSANGKRFTRHNSTQNTTLRFGFDLSPLFLRLQELAKHAAEARQEKEAIAYTRCKIRAIAQEILLEEPDNELALAAIKMLRRKVSLAAFKEALEQLSAVHNIECYNETSTEVTTKMSSSDGQNVRHHHRSKKEHIDKEVQTNTSPHNPNQSPTPVSVAELLTACPEAAQFSLRKIESFNDAISHARTLAPMMGIDSNNYEAAENHLGIARTAITIWVLMQFQDRIQKIGAYFRAITTGTKSAAFSPEKLVQKLARAHGFQSRTMLSADNLN